MCIVVLTLSGLLSLSLARAGVQIQMVSDQMAMLTGAVGVPSHRQRDRPGRVICPSK
jgi:hypothetical protein